MFGLSVWEIVIIFLIVVILFGAGKLPELGTGVGEAIRNFRKSYRDTKTIDVTSGNETNTQTEKDKVAK